MNWLSDVLSSPGFTAMMTFLAGLVGSLLGLVGSGLAAWVERSAKFREITFSRRELAYKAVLDAATDCERHYGDMDRLAAFYAARNAAVLLASNVTREGIEQFGRFVETGDFTSGNYKRAKQAVLDAMREDLLSQLK